MITKIYEKVLLVHLQAFSTSHNAVHHTQIGFQAKMSTHTNIFRLANLMTDAKNKEVRARALKIKVNLRVKQFVVYIDLRRAFDSICRS